MSQISPPSTLSWAFIAARVLSAVTWRLVSIPFRWFNWKGGPTIFEDTFFAALRTLLGHCDTAIFRTIFKPTAEVYHDSCKQTGRASRSLSAKGVKSHWIGNENADVVVLYFHGGGFVCAASIDHFKYLDGLERDINNSRDGTLSIAFLVLEYSLAPEEGIFPTQLCEAATTLSHLISVCGRSPSDIILAGDSAGGSLVMALLSHILHPKEGVPRVEIQKPLRGALAISPWVSFSTDFHSYTRNAQSDTLVPSIMKIWSAMYLGQMDVASEHAVTWPVKSNDAYAEALVASPAWWSGLDKVVGRMLVWVGGKELLQDPIVDFVSKLKDGWKSKGGLEEDIVFIQGKDEPHIGPILNISLGNKTKKSSQVAVEAWLLDLLHSDTA